MRYSDKSPSDLAIKASKASIEKTDINLDMIDFIIFCGVEGDYAEPSTAHAVQAALDLKNCTCFDVSNACLGFATGLQLADSLIASKAARYVLVCTGEKLSELSKSVIKELQHNPDLGILEKKIGFMTVGDAGGAAILGPKHSKKGFMSFTFTSQGEYNHLCYYKKQGNMVDGQMVMNKISAAGLRAHKIMYQQSLEVLHWQPNDVDCLITHQVGRRPFERLSEVFSVNKNRMTKSYDTLGNIATATFPVNYSLGVEKGLINNNKNLFAAMAGSGLSICQIGIAI